MRLASSPGHGSRLQCHEGLARSDERVFWGIREVLARIWIPIKSRNAFDDIALKPASPAFAASEVRRIFARSSALHSMICAKAVEGGSTVGRRCKSCCRCKTYFSIFSL